MKNKILSTIVKLQNSKDGATAIEYGLIAALVSVVIIVALTFVGTELNTTFNSIGNSLDTANP